LGCDRAEYSQPGLFALQALCYNTLKPHPLFFKSMATNTTLEERMAAVEAAILKIQQQIAHPQSSNWLEQITGSFKDEPAFEDILAYGRAIRRGDESVLDAPEME